MEEVDSNFFLVDDFEWFKTSVEEINADMLKIARKLELKWSQKKEQQGEIRKPSSVINAKKQRKIIEWETLNKRSHQEN